MLSRLDLLEGRWVKVIQRPEFRIAKNLQRSKQQVHVLFPYSQTPSIFQASPDGGPML
jgi:hypothetical protein